MSRRVSIAHLTALDTPPPDFIHMAADAGFSGVGLRMIGLSADATAWPLMTDKPMLRATIAACRETGLIVPDIEFIRLTPELDVKSLEAFVATGAELGAKHIITAPYDPDADRLAGKLAALNTIAKLYGMTCVLEFFPWAAVPDLATAMNVIARTQDPDIGVLVDSLHFDRSGAPWAELAQIPASRLPFCHLADAESCKSRELEALLFVARENRFAPGEGALDLVRFLSTLPADCPIAVEIPNAAQLQARGTAAWLKHVAAATHQMLAKLPKTAKALS
jgi:sugar phosphate isomerase/epimerase